ncbi:chorismate transformation enzyme, FkbO/Hyg5 family [Coraliomargarita sp. W4R53]
MDLLFHYNATAPYIDANDNGLQIGIMNSSCAQTIERWSLPEGKHTQRGDFHLIESDTYTLAAASIPVCPENLAQSTESLYQQLLADHPEFSLYRIWHFIPQINDVPAGHIENYRAFCTGRALAFEAHTNEALHSKIPAASAVGTVGQHLTLVYLAGKALSTHFENPRQTPAYKYPSAYGPKPPAFARATTVNFNNAPTLFISGTASILASESIGNTIESQLATTIENLKIVAARSAIPTEPARRIRVYLRHADDFDYVKAQLEAHYLTKGDQAYYIVADICRKELLVEIEATIGQC